MFHIASILLTLFCLFPILIIYWYYSRIWRVNQFFRKYPSPPTTQYTLDNLNNYIREYGPMVHLKMGLMQNVLLTSDYNFIEFLLSSPVLITKTPQLNLLKEWIGNNLGTATGNEWRNTRKLLTPAFHFKILEQFIDVFESGGDELIKELGKQNGSKGFDICSTIMSSTFSMFCESAIGLTIDAKDKKVKAYFDNLDEMFKINNERWTSMLKSYKFFFRFTKNYKRYKELIQFFHNFTGDVIKAKIEQRKRRQSDSLALEKKKRKAFLDLLLDAADNGANLSFQKIRSEVDMFTFAGHDTTSTAIEFTLYSLASYPEIQNRVYREQQTLFGNEKSPNMTYAKLQKMHYLENVIKETLRFYPSAPIYGRFVDKDVAYNGTTIPKGTIIAVFLPGLHMNPQFFPEPHKFDPDRFDDKGEPYPFAFIPFSAGPRNCIGQKYALLELKSVISKIIRNYKLIPSQPPHKPQLFADFTLKSANGVKIAIKLRDNQENRRTV